MDFNYTEEQEAFRHKVRAWLHANQPAPISRAEKEAADEESAWRRLVAWHKTLYAGGWAGLSWPKQYGGRGASYIEQLIFGQELARLNLPVGCNVLGIIMTGPALMQWGTEAQKRRFLEPILKGDEIWCEGMSEPGAGSDLAAIQTRAMPEGDSFVVNGQKVWTTLAHRAQFCQLFVRTDLTLPKHKGLSCLLVDMKSPGVAVKPLRQITGEAEFNEIFFEDVRVPRENLLGPLNGGWQVLLSTLMHERFGIGETLSSTQQTLDELLEIARRVRVGDRPAGKDHEVRQQLAQFAIEAAAKKYNGLRSLTRRLKGLPPGPEASISKLVSTELTQRMVKYAGRLLGHYSLLQPRTRLALEGAWLRRILYSESFTIAGGTTMVQKNMIGERMLQLPRD